MFRVFFFASGDLFRNMIICKKLEMIEHSGAHQDFNFQKISFSLLEQKTAYQAFRFTGSCKVTFSLLQKFFNMLGRGEQGEPISRYRCPL